MSCLLSLPTTILVIVVIGSCIVPDSNGWLLSSSSSSSFSLLLSASSPHLPLTTKTKAGKERVSVSLLSSTTTGEIDGPPFATIIGGNGRIGATLAQAGNCIVVSSKEETIDPNGSGPIFVATRNDALEYIINVQCPKERHADLVFVQNGYLNTYLQSKNLVDSTTQVLLYLSVAAKGMAPIDGVTTYNPEGLTKAYGKHANNFAQRLQALDLKCLVCTTEEDFLPAMYEKLMWITTYMLVGTANGCASVGEASKDYPGQIATIVNEMKSALERKYGIVFEQGTLERLASYTDVVADFPCGVKEFEWRNEFFWNLGDELVPTHNKLLRECSEKGKLPFDLPPTTTDTN